MLKSVRFIGYKKLGKNFEEKVKYGEIEKMKCP